MRASGVIILILIFLAIAGLVGWFVVYPQLRARKLGLPPPPLNPFASSKGSSALPGPRDGGAIGWVKDKISTMRNKRYASGAYEGSTGRGNHHPLDPDEAWDTRVGHEADAYGGTGGYYEEQELGPRVNNAGYAGAGHNNNDGRGRSRQRDLDDRYDEEMGRAPKGHDNPFGDGPFGDTAERSELPTTEPHAAGGDHASSAQNGGHHDGTERRSLFHEDV